VEKLDLIHADIAEEPPTTVFDDRFYYEAAWALVEQFLEITYPDEGIEGSVIEKWERANATVGEMWEQVRPVVDRELNLSGKMEVRNDKGSFGERVGEGR